MDLVRVESAQGVAVAEDSGDKKRRQLLWTIAEYEYNNVRIKFVIQIIAFVYRHQSSLDSGTRAEYRMRGKYRVLQYTYIRLLYVLIMAGEQEDLLSTRFTDHLDRVFAIYPIGRPSVCPPVTSN